MNMEELKVKVRVIKIEKKNRYNARPRTHVCSLRKQIKMRDKITKTLEVQQYIIDYDKHYIKHADRGKKNRRAVFSINTSVNVFENC